MRSFMPRCTCLLAAAALLPLTASSGQTDRSASSTLDASRSAVRRVKGLYFATDYDSAVVVAGRLLEQFPKSRELAAWRVAALARSDHPREAERAAATLLSASQTDPWGWFAKTLYLEYGADRSTAADVRAAS